MEGQQNPQLLQNPCNVLDIVYKSLRFLPEFDGNPNVLTRFIHLCDQLVEAHVRQGQGNELCNIALLNGILNKVTGPAARLINTNGIPDSWSGIRSALINNFADQRDESALYNDLSLLTQRHSTPQEFYEKCQNLFSTIMTYVSLHETVPTTIEAKRDLYKKLTLQTYLRGLNDPLGSRIRCMRPSSMEKALELVHEEVNTIYLQQRNAYIPEKWTPYQALSTHRPPTLPTRPILNWANQRPQQSFALPLQRQPWEPNNPNRIPTRTEQIFSAPPPNYRAQSNMFRLPPRHPMPNQGPSMPRPMSGVSHFDTRPMPLRGHDFFKQGNPPPGNYFKSREMNFNDVYDYYNYDSNENDQYYYNESDYTKSDYEQCTEPGYSNYTVEETTSENTDNEKISEGSNYRQTNIEVNLQTQRQLPYIQIHNPPLKLLIDTGANQSFISPEAVQKYFPQINLDYNPFVVTNVHTTSKNDYSITIPCFPEFNEDDNITLFMYKFHDYFDGLIGTDLLDKFESNVDYKNKILVTKSAKNPIQVYDSRNCNLYDCVIPNQSSKLIKLPINIGDGEALVPEQTISNCIIDECTNADTLSRIEIHNVETNSILVNPPSEKQDHLSPNSDTLTADTITAHTIMKSHIRNRKPEIQYTPEQQVFVLNPMASRQKLAPRFTQDTVLADLPIHIYTKKKRDPIARVRLKRTPNDKRVLQDNTADSSADSSTGDNA